MKKIFRIALVASVIATAFTTACKKKDDDSSTPAPPTGEKTETIKGEITASRTLVDSIEYTIEGLVYVNDGVTLTIPAGTVILGDKASKGALIVQRGGKLVANGTESKPIVFSSSAPAGYRNAGDWGGIILCGRAANNQNVDQVVEGPTDFSTVSGKGLFGGTAVGDNSGSLKYVRIEFAGIAYAPNKEINSLTMASVGSGTTIEHVQASFGGDDSFEWFGGDVNAKFLVAYKGWDDDFDTDFGYSGKVQFGVALRGATIADQSGSNGFESDNDATGSGNTPQTKAIFSNISILGPFLFVDRDKDGNLVKGNINGNFQHAAHIRRNSAQVVSNSVILGFPIAVNFDKTAGTLKFTNNVIGVYQTRAAFVAGNGNDTTGYVAQNTWSNAKLGTDVLASTATESTAGLLAATSPALNGADFTKLGLDDAFFTKTTYRGAFGTTPDAAWNWNAGWLNFDPSNTQY